ncbi:MAG: DUF262 domain-containing protein [Neomegalonema sp.]|nr:DUF262 domain-containing protein [Neomegalonema sp.]
MKADVVSLRALFSGPHGLAAPFHQRPYRWVLDRNWRPFWAHWRAVADPAAGSGAPEGRNTNFLGAIVCRNDPDASERDGPDGAVRPLEVLDGQQRLLTAMMAAHALTLHARRLGLDDLANALGALLLDSQGRPKFVAGRSSFADQMAALRTETPPDPPPTSGKSMSGFAAADPLDDDAEAGEAEEDSSADPFDDFARRAAAGQLEPREDQDAAAEGEGETEWGWDDETGAGAEHLRCALRFFCAEIAQRLADADRPADELIRLSAALLDQSVVVAITLEGAVSPFDVFERLNNLGEPLSALDLVKNQLFRSAEKSGLSRSALEALYRSEWRVFDDASSTRFWSAPERRGRDRRPAQDWFLRAYLSVREARNVSMAEAVERVHELANGAPADAPGQIKALCRGARAFAEVSGHLDPGPHRVRIDALRRFARFAVEPALVAMRMHLWADDRATGEILAMLESVAVRRFFAGSGTGRDYEVYARLARVIGPGAAKDGRACVREVARRLKAAQKGEFWPKDGVFKREFATRKLANRNSNQQARDRKAVFRAVFEALDGAARGAAPSDPTPWRQEGRTVEHLFPLHGREYWPELGKSEVGLLETIGNLTLIEDALNKEMGQAPWSKKRTMIGRDEEVFLNRALLEEKKWRDEWGPAQIKERGRALAELAVKRWPRPR